MASVKLALDQAVPELQFMRSYLQNQTLNITLPKQIAASLNQVFTNRHLDDISCKVNHPTNPIWSLPQAALYQTTTITITEPAPFLFAANEGELFEHTQCSLGGLGSLMQ